MVCMPPYSARVVPSRSSCPRATRPPKPLASRVVAVVAVGGGGVGGGGRRRRLLREKLRHLPRPRGRLRRPAVLVPVLLVLLVLPP